MVSMRPVLQFRDPPSTISAQSVAFLYKTKYKPLMFALNVANEQFQEAANAIRTRSNLQLNVCQPLMETAGIRSNQEITDKDVHDAIGDRNYHLLKDSTEAVVYLVDNFVRQGDNLRKELIKAFSDVFSKEEVFNFELLDEPVTNIYTYD